MTRLGVMRVAATATAALANLAAAGQSAKEPLVDLAGLLARVGERVEAYYQRAQSIVCIEIVRLQSMDNNLTLDPHVRRLEYELRVSRDKAVEGAEPSDANVLRTLKTINGTSPRPGQEPACLD